MLSRFRAAGGSPFWENLICRSTVRNMSIVFKRKWPEVPRVGCTTVWGAFRYPIEIFSPRVRKLRISPHPSLAILGLGWGPRSENYFWQMGCHIEGASQANSKTSEILSCGHIGTILGASTFSVIFEVFQNLTVFHHDHP